MRPIITFTTFWNANKVISMLPNNNFRVHSIALSNPALDKLPNLKDMSRLDIFCPSWEILNKYKQDKNWEDYTKSFMELMHTRNKEVKEWLNSLSHGYRYFLCCWENTSKGSNCHRRLLYDAFKNSKLKDKYHFLYYHV